MINPLGLVYVFELMNEMNEIKYSVFDLDLIIILYHFHVMKEILYERNKPDLRPLSERKKIAHYHLKDRHFLLGRE